MAKPKEYPLPESEEYHEDPVKCGYRKIDVDLDPHDRERNPIGGLRYNRRDNSGGRQLDVEAEKRKDAAKQRKLPRCGA